MARLIDFSASLIDPAAIRGAGFDGVVGYFSESRPGANFGAKPLRKDYCDRLRAAGLEIVTNYQYGKGDTSDWKGGFDAGVHHARIALANHFAGGGPAFRPLYAPVDSNPTLTEWNIQIAPFLRGWESVVGHEWTGIYCNARCIEWALEDGLGSWFWQHNWSGDASINGDHPAAHIHQVRIDSDQVAGVGVDVNITLKDDYGQWSKAAAVVCSSPAQGVPPVASKPTFTELDRMTGGGSSPRSRPPVNWLLHTEEGNSSAENLAAYCNGDHDASYHYTLRDGILCDVVDTDYASWSVLDANAYTINLCFAGSRAAWSRDQWLTRNDDLRIAAYIAVQDCRKYGIPTDVITPPYHKASGISDHRYVTECLGIGSHTDVGDGFPWDVFAGYVNEFTNGQGDDMAALDETFTNFKGQKVSLGTAVRYLDQYVNEIRDQLGGPDPYTGWPQLGNRTVVDALAVIGEKLGIDGFKTNSK